MTKSKREKVCISFDAYIVDYPSEERDEEEISGFVFVETYTEAQKKIGELVDRERKKRGMPPNGIEIVLMSEEDYCGDPVGSDFAVVDKETFEQLWD